MNIAGSIAGILLFTAGSRWQLGPAWWFGGVMVATAYFLLPERRLAVSCAGARAGRGAFSHGRARRSRRRSRALQETWSPYYRIDYHPESQGISVNLIGQQSMVSRADVLAGLLAAAPAESRQRQAAVRAGAGHRRRLRQRRQPRARLGRRAHRRGGDRSGDLRAWAAAITPTRPTPTRASSPTWTTAGITCTRPSKQYDLIVYALVDSLVLHSSYSNIRLESYLFTTQAFADVKKRLKPGGLFVMYNYFRQGWIVVAPAGHARRDVRCRAIPSSSTCPRRTRCAPTTCCSASSRCFLPARRRPIKQAFARHPEYWLANGRVTDRVDAERLRRARRRRARGGDGRAAGGARRWLQFRTTTVVAAADAPSGWPPTRGRSSICSGR